MTAVADRRARWPTNGHVVELLRDTHHKAWGGADGDRARSRRRDQALASRLAMAAPRSPGDFTVVTPAASSAANLPAAVPLPPDAIAPAWPMRLPSGALAPAMKPTTGLVTCLLMNSA